MASAAPEGTKDKEKDQISGDRLGHSARWSLWISGSIHRRISEYDGRKTDECEEL